MTSPFNQILRPDQVVTAPSDLQHYGKDWSQDFEAKPSVILFPENVAEVQKIVVFCKQNNLALVPSGGRTGLSGGATAINSEAVLSLERLRKIHGVDVKARLITCEAGVTTQAVQLEAEKHSLYFPIDFASKGSSQIGGNIATNAGGVRVIRYGKIDRWVFGLKVVTAQGELLDLGRGLIKDQSGYNLLSLFIGSEGTLGVITEVTLGLTSQPKGLVRVLAALDSYENMLVLLAATQSQFPGLSMFEYLPRIGLEKVLAHNARKDPFLKAYPVYVLLELEEQEDQSELMRFFERQLENQSVADVIVSAGTQQFEALLEYRELLPESLNRFHVVHKNDISVPLSQIPSFLRSLETALSKSYAGFETVTFGHIGDGNFHLNILKPETISRDQFFKKCKQADLVIAEVVQNHAGSISAEHGVGLLKKDLLKYCRSETELELMRKIKLAFDPANILNPGKVL